jgi:hypothetical protein
MLLIWWLGYLALFVLELVQRRASGGDTLDDITSYSNTTMVLIVTQVVAAIFAIVVVRQITAAQETRRA